MLKFASTARGRCCAKVFSRVLEWNGKKHSIFMPCAAIEWLRMSLKEFQQLAAKKDESVARLSDSLHLGKGGQAFVIRRVD